MNNLWLLIGPGGIGRGLIAPIAAESHKIIFVTPNQENVRFFKKNPEYKVIYYSPHNNRKKEKIIRNYDAVSSANLKKLSLICSSPDLKIISTSVRVDNLEKVAKILSQALKNRKEKIIILVCENIENGGDRFKELLEKEVKGITKKIIIPNISVDCMIPPHKSETLIIEREKFGELVIERPKDKITRYLEKLPNVQLIKGKIIRHYKKKIIGVSGLHAGIAWMGFDRSHKYVYQAARDPKLRSKINQLIREIVIAIFEETKFPKKEILKYLKQARARISNVYLKDPNERFFRNLRKKLNVNERFLGPALKVWQKGYYPSSLLKIIAIGFKKLVKEEKIKDIKKSVIEICRLPKSAQGLEKEIFMQIGR